MKQGTQRIHWGPVVLAVLAAIAFQAAPSIARWFEPASAPAAALPYLVQQVGFDNAAGGIRLAGTLTMPPGAGPHPAIVLIPGSGSVDRDGAVLGHRFYQVLADDLTRRGFAVLRSDKRGLGGSGGDFASATSYDFASDIQAALAFLRSHPGIAAGRIGLVGHSEGALVGSIVAGRDAKVAFLVTMAGNGIPAGEMFLARAARQVEGGAQAVARERALLKAVFAAAQAPGSDAERKAALHAIYAKAKAGYGRPFSEDEYAPYLTPWMRTLLSIDPQPFLRQLRCPVLALVGGKDRVVTADANIPALQQALAANTRARVERLPGLNHFFQSARTGEFDEVAGIRETMSPRALALIGNWAKQQ